ncbi:MAG: hypothetical protein AAFY57_17145 [Cyanobacteria bacterium J06642_2]
MQEIRMKYFFLPVLLQVQSNPGGENVIIRRPAVSGTIEFLRLPVHVAHQLAEFLETAAENATATPVVSGQIGEINGDSVRALGTAKVRIRVSVARSNSIRFAIRETVTRLGRKTQHSRPTLSVEEARRFANSLREANVVSA